MSANLEMLAQQAESMGDAATAAQIRGMITGLTSLSSAYGQFHSGLTTYTEGVSSLALSYSALQGGTSALSDGLDRLNRGAAEVASGSNTLAGQTADLPDRLASEAEKMVGAYDKGDFKPQSFFSDKNDSVSLVQFVLRTDAIALPEPPSASETEPESDTFWTRLMALFR
jgi:X-X-X-Leu-X-X-Gly heptad repeat protein